MNSRDILFLAALSMFTFGVQISSFGQDSEFDSLRSALETISDHKSKFKSITDLAWAYSRSDPPRSLKYSEWARELAEQENDEDLLAHVNYYFGTAHKNLGNYQKALNHFATYHDFFLEKEDMQKICFVYYQTGIVKMQMGNYLGALDDFLNNLKLARELGLKGTEANTLSVIATVHSKMKNFNKAIAYNEEALAIFIELEDKNGQGQCIANNANYYSVLNNLDMADSMYREGLALFEETGDSYMLGHSYFNLGELQILKGNLGEGESFILKSISMRQDLGHQKDLAESYVGLGNLYVRKNEGQKALLQFQLAMGLAEAVSSLELEKKITGGLAKTYELLTDFQKSAQYYKALNTLSDSILNQEITQQISELNIRFETELKENQIQLLQKDQLITKRNQSLFAAAAFLFLMASLGIFILYKNRKRSIKKLEEKNGIISKMLEEKEFLIKEIHHRVKNNLQIISSLLQLQSRYVDEPLALAALTEGESRVRSMSIIHHHLYTESNLSQVNVPQYIDNLCSNLLASYNYKNLDISIEKDIDDIALDVSVMIPLGLIINELITNAFKYAFEGKDGGKIIVKIKEWEDKLQVSVRDNGIGFDHKSTKAGFGNRLIQTFLKKLEATSETLLGEGTEIQITLDKYKKELISRRTG
ncbi:histidine kinase dimerization/phosphoacceptor domain -containing protein [Algoriphagus sp.]|uniref:tetratricopeptide repeat-containing sensor histidine kinase n=1 Tax=Algoriphagus sp. TaxID=1872435 RepID=UPI00391C428F